MVCNAKNDRRKVTHAPAGQSGLDPFLFFWDAGDVSESRFWPLVLGEGVWRGEEVIQGDRTLILFLSL
jgi:hypothetical protein